MSALETSVTLEDVFQVVQGRRVPLAAELAGYLALEIAEGAAAAAAATGLGGDVDPRAVFIGEEGSVALVRPKRDASAAAPAGDTEASIRNILAMLLEASGSKTPALGAVARAQNRPGEGLRKLVEQLETALIPVNRAAGRRALARLAREVKRVTQGVGRNATRAGRDGEDAGPRSTRESALAAAAHAIGESRRPARDELADLLDNRSSEMPASVLSIPAGMSSPPLATANTAPAPSHPNAEPTPAPPPVPLPPTPPPPPVVFEPRPEPRAGVSELVDAFGVSGGQAEQPAVSRELKAMAGLEPTPPPPAGAYGARLANVDAFGATMVPDDAGIEALLADAARSEKPPAATVPADEPVEALPPASAPISTAAKGPAAPAVTPPPAHVAKPALQLITSDAAPPLAPVGAQLARGMTTMKIDRPASKRGAERFLWPLVVVVVLAAGAGLFVMRPALFPGHPGGTDPSATASNTGATPPATVPMGSASGSGAPATGAHDPTRCRAILLVNDAPAGSEILLREGTAPADIERMPVGARLEFVTTDEGFGPKRIVVPADATWDHGADGRPRYELGVQLDPSKAKPGQVDPWPPAEPGSEAGGNGPAGTVHIVSTPKGAEIWLLAGIGPQAKIDQQVRCDADLDVLVAGPTTFRKRLHKTAAELAQSPTTTGANGTVERTVTLSAK